nr:MAG: hypothetical protein [Microvirus sp.]
MYKKKTPTTSSVKRNTTVIGETIEQKMERIINNKEPIKDGAPIIYTERKHGVAPQYNIRTDRFEIALDAADNIAKSYMARRENRGQTETGTENVAETGAEEVGGDNN